MRFLDVNDKLADADGRLYDGMMPDKLHPSVKGYQVWADGLKPMLTELPRSAGEDRPGAAAHRRSVEAVRNRADDLLRIR